MSKRLRRMKHYNVRCYVIKILEPYFAESDFVAYFKQFEAMSPYIEKEYEQLTVTIFITWTQKEATVLNTYYISYRRLSPVNMRLWFNLYLNNSIEEVPEFTIMVADKLTPIFSSILNDGFISYRNTSASIYSFRVGVNDTKNIANEPATSIESIQLWVKKQKSNTKGSID